MSTSTDLLRFFESMSTHHIQQNLNPINVSKMKTDKHYALKIFLSGYAFARAGAPGGYRIAAIKSASFLQSVHQSKTDLWTTFREFYGGKLNTKLNPCADKRLTRTDLSGVINNISKGELSQAFSQLTFHGIGHKIRALFIRDMAYLTKSHSSGDPNDVKWHLYAQPVDTWIRQTGQRLIPRMKSPIAFDDSYSLNKEDFRLGTCIITLCLESGLSPLKVNMGIWYYCARVVADATRLRNLLRKRSVVKLDKELALIGEFLP